MFNQTFWFSILQPKNILNEGKNCNIGLILLEKQLIIRFIKTNKIYSSKTNEENSGR